MASEFSISNFSLKLASVVSNLSNPKSNSFYLTKYLLGFRLASFPPEWHFLLDNSTPSSYDSTIYYEKCFSALTTLRGIVSRKEWQDFDFASEKCYQALLRENSASPILHRFWSPFLPIDFKHDNLRKLVRDDFSENYNNDVLWSIVLRAIKVRDSLKH